MPEAAESRREARAERGEEGAQGKWHRNQGSDGGRPWFTTEHAFHLEPSCTDQHIRLRASGIFTNSLEQ